MANYPTGISGQIGKFSSMMGMSNTSSPFAPLRLSTYAVPALFTNGEQGVWYDPSNFASMFQDSAGTIPVTATGQPVGMIRDQSGRGNHATQSFAGSRPLLQQDGTGRFCLVFDGIDDFLISSSIDFTASNKMTMFAGFRKVTDPAAGILMEFGTNGNTAGNFYLSSTESSGVYGVRVGGAGFNHSGFNAPITSVITGAWNMAGATVNAVIADRINTTPVTTTAVGTAPVAGNFANAQLYIGARTGTAFFFAGRLYSLVLRGTVTSQEQIVATEAYVNSKTGAY